MDLPLYRKQIIGTPLSKDSGYEKTESDEVEDLYDLLVEIQAKHPDVKGWFCSHCMNAHAWNNIQSNNKN